MQMTTKEHFGREMRQLQMAIEREWSHPADAIASDADPDKRNKASCPSGCKP